MTSDEIAEARKLALGARKYEHDDLGALAETIEALCNEVERYRRAVRHKNSIAHAVYDLWDCSSKIDGDIRESALWKRLGETLVEAGYTR